MAIIITIPPLFLSFSFIVHMFIKIQTTACNEVSYTF